MQTATVLPPLAPFQEISRLLAWLNYLWACYQALLGNYHALKAENAQLRERAAHAEQRAAHAEQRAAHAEQRAAYAERCAAHRRLMNENLHVQISDLEYHVKEAEQNVYEAEQRADEAEQRADEAEKELNALNENQCAEALILHELSNDKSWTSVSKMKFVNRQTKAVLDANAKVEDMRSKLQTSIECCERLVESISQLFKCPVDLSVPESTPVLCVGTRNGPAFFSSVETTQKMNLIHPLIRGGETFVTRTLSGLVDTIEILFKTQAQNALLAKFLQQ